MLIHGSYSGNGKKIAIVVGRFNEFITESLLNGAKDTLIRNNVKEDNITIIKVPGALEIPLVIKQCAESNNYDGIIALGAVIRGATSHFEYVSGFASNSVSQIGLDYNIPVLNGILTVENIEQAIERAGTKAGNKGSDCALSVLEMIDILDQLK